MLDKLGLTDWADLQWGWTGLSGPNRLLLGLANGLRTGTDWAGLGRRELGRLSYRWTGLGCRWTQAVLLDTDRHELCPCDLEKNEPIRLMSSEETEEKQMHFGGLMAVREDRPEGESVELKDR
ncbi:hypothetical protein CRG98_039606 [Punica granatum]|uniref:Uncharacterized protein n=1 Tax=Punica granatum TaxID=22663 RepID=A0A2I0I818_PUNGR|nr:hypothetical protein CRG98_039606 [Punica granatum]